MIGRLLCWLFGHRWAVLDDSQLYAGIFWGCGRCACVDVVVPEVRAFPQRPTPKQAREYDELYDELYEMIEILRGDAMRHVERLEKSTEWLREEVRQLRLGYMRLPDGTSALADRVTNVEGHISKLWETIPAGFHPQPIATGPATPVTLAELQKELSK